MSDSRSPNVAVEIEDDDADDDTLEEMFLTFRIDDSEYAVCLTHVIEIVVGQRIIPVPDVPAFLMGVINLRGRVIPVVDVRLRFGLTPQVLHPRLSIVVVEYAGESTGLAVDEVQDVRQIPPHTVSPPLNTRLRNSELVQGIGRRSDGVSFILHVARFLETTGGTGEGLHAARESLGAGP